MLQRLAGTNFTLTFEYAQVIQLFSWEDTDTTYNTDDREDTDDIDYRDYTDDTDDTDDTGIR